jgi:cellulose synthase/poly-beta-1,6-N-acetylglucosamine synthase-like glycosyltransferase
MASLASWLGLAWGTVASGGPLPLLLAGSLLTVLAWLFLARRPAPDAAAAALQSPDRVWLRTVLGAVLGELFAYVSAAALFAIRTGSFLGLLVPFLIPAPLVLGTVLGALSGALSARRHWRAEGVLAYLGLGFLSFGFIEYVLDILRRTPLGPAWALAFALLATESFGFVVVLLYQFYSIEFLSGIPRRRPPPAPVVESGDLPYVAVQVACYNEPPAMVRKCLESIRALTYPRDRLAVQLLDDSTDPEASRVLGRLCEELGVQHVRRSHRRGYKAGALNDGTALLSDRVTLIALVDADYRVAPGFLTRTVGSFRDPRVAWVQTPQAYWNAEESTFTHFYALADAYFYRVIQPVRDEAGSSIFCGTMGVLRRRALQEVGGWDEQCITEDAELSLRLYAAGWTSVYLPEVLGEGYAPDRFPDLKSQFSRWAFGGLQMLRKDFSILRSPRLTLRQRADFLASGVFWTDGIFLLLMAGAIVTMTLGSLTGLAWAAPSPPLLIGLSLAPVLLVADGVVKTRLALGRVVRLRNIDAVGVMGFWYALKVVNLRASLRALLRRPMGFQRTPKRGEPSTVGARGGGWIRSVSLELTLAVSIAAVAAGAALAAGPGSIWTGVGRAVLIAWLGYYAALFAAAPLFGWLAGVKRPRSTG